MKKELLISDLDGCISNNFNLKEIRQNLKILSLRYDIVITTGREYGTIRNLINDDEIMKYLLGISLANGAIYALKSNLEYIYLTDEEKEKIKELVEVFQFFSNNIEIYACIPGRSIFLETTEIYHKYINSNLYEVKIAFAKERVEELNWITNYMVSKRMEFFIDTLSNKDYYYIEIKHDKVNKISTVEKNIDVTNYDRVLVLGDSINDMPLLSLNNDYKKYTTNKKLVFLKDVTYISSIHDLMIIQSKNISSSFTENKVYNFNNIIIKKLNDIKAYENEYYAYQILDEKLRPNLLGLDKENKIIIIEKCDEISKINYNELIKLIKAFHKSTLHEGYVGYVNERKRYNNWKEYLHENAVDWIENTSFYIKDAKTKIDKLINYVDKYTSCNNTVCLLHRDIRKKNIGMKDGQYVLFDFELIIWGNPIWDFARLLYQVDNKKDEDIIYKKSGYKKKELDVYKCIYAFSFLAYFYDSFSKNKKEITNCIRVIENFQYESI